MATTLAPAQIAAHVNLSQDRLRYSEGGHMPRVQRLLNGTDATASRTSNG